MRSRISEFFQTNLQELIKNGKIGAIQVGQRTKIAVREILRFLDENTVRNKKLNSVNYLPVKSQYYRSADEIFYNISATYWEDSSW
jgi:hypothetical protein